MKVNCIFTVIVNVLLVVLAVLVVLIRLRCKAGATDREMKCLQIVQEARFCC